MTQKADKSGRWTGRNGGGLLAVLAGVFALAGAAMAGSDSWSLKLSPSIGTQTGTPVTLGEVGDASDSLDGTYDAPVLKDNPAISAYFPHPEWGASDRNYWIDIQSNGAQKSWPLTASSSVLGRKLRLAWDPGALPSGHIAVMTDTLTGQRVDMTSEAGYAFYNHLGDERRFMVTVSDPLLDNCPDENHPGLDSDGDGCKDGDGVDLKASIKGSADTAVVGDNLSYQVEVRNDGSLPAEGVVLTAFVPSNAVFVSATGSCSLATLKVICDLGGLPAGSVTSLEIIMRAKAAGLLTSRVEAVTSSSGDPIEDDNQVAYRTQVNQVVASEQGASGGSTSVGEGGGSGGGAFDPLVTLLLSAFAAVVVRRRRRETFGAGAVPRVPRV